MLDGVMFAVSRIMHAQTSHVINAKVKMLDALVAWLWHLSTMVDQLSYVDKFNHQLGRFYVAQ